VGSGATGFSGVAPVSVSSLVEFSSVLGPNRMTHPGIVEYATNAARPQASTGVEVVLLPRPRRFGKTLNLSMLRCFFEKQDACVFFRRAA
jgi:hypothetical protein